MCFSFFRACHVGGRVYMRLSALGIVLFWSWVDGKRQEWRSSKFDWIYFAHIVRCLAACFSERRYSAGTEPKISFCFVFPPKGEDWPNLCRRSSVLVWSNQVTVASNDCFLFLWVFRFLKAWESLYSRMRVSNRRMSSEPLTRRLLTSQSEPPKSC